MDIFDRLHFEPKEEDGTITVTIPSYRPDMEGLADLSEEVIRIAGYDRLPSTLPLMEMTEGKLDEAQKMKRKVADILLENGLQDTVTYTLISDDKHQDAILSAGEAYVLSTPLSEEERSFALPSCLHYLKQLLIIFRET